MRWVAVFLLFVGCNTSETQRAEGREIFAGNCARCHGANGGGGPALTDGGNPPRNLRDPEWQKTVSDEQLRQIITRGKSPTMPAFDQALDGPRIQTVITYVRSLPTEKAQ